jgi:cephalosporin hydroxylase
VITPLVDIGASLAVVGRQQRHGMLKIAEDLDRYRHVIEADRPEVIVECGTWLGGSARWFAALGPEVITVDTVRRASASGGPRITWLVGSSTASEVVERVATLVSGRRTMVVLDSDHSAAHVAAEIRLYGPLVTPGCHLVVEDGIARWMDLDIEGSPMDPIESILLAGSEFDRDEQTEAMYPISMYPCGWWVRRATCS